MFAILGSQLAKERNGGVSVAWAGDASEHRMERKEETGGGGGSVAGLLVLLVFGGGIRWRLVLRESTRGDNMREPIWGSNATVRFTRPARAALCRWTSQPQPTPPPPPPPLPPPPPPPPPRPLAGPTGPGSNRTPASIIVLGLPIRPQRDKS